MGNTSKFQNLSENWASLELVAVGIQHHEGNTPPKHFRNIDAVGRQQLNEPLQLGFVGYFIFNRLLL